MYEDSEDKAGATWLQPELVARWWEIVPVLCVMLGPFAWSAVSAMIHGANLQIIDMNKFIRWANTSEVTNVLFAGLPEQSKKGLWFDEVSKKLGKRQKYGDLAPYMPGD